MNPLGYPQSIHIAFDRQVEEPTSGCAGACVLYERLKGASMASPKSLSSTSE